MRKYNNEIQNERICVYKVAGSDAASRRNGARYGVNEQMGIFTVRGENQFQKGSIDTQHTVSLLVLKGEISIQTNDKRTVIPAPSYIEFIEPYQWSDLKTDRDFEGCLLITRREIFFAGSRMHPFQGRSLCIQTRTRAVHPIRKTGSSPDTITCGHATPHPSAKRESFPG